MPFWDYIHFGRPDEERQQHRNLQEGLLQIASQTCSILVQVNNTNNISYGNNSTNIQYNNYSPNSSGRDDYSGDSGSGSTSRNTNRPTNSDVDVEQSVVLIPSTSTGSIRGSTKTLFSHYKHRLSVSFVYLARTI